MRRRWMLVTGTLSLFLWGMALAQAAVSFKAADGVQVFGELYKARTDKPIILLFHQAEYNKAEYAKIGPRLVKAGFNALAIDQRSGGDSQGGENLTVRKLGQSTSYLEALPALEAALQWAKSQRYKKILVWGSSYSSALVFLLAAKHPEIAGVLSFSPGEYLGSEHGVRDAAAKVKVPTFVTSSGTQDEVGQAHPIFLALGSKDKTEYKPDGIGFHGSLALLLGLPRITEGYWKAVLGFLNKFR